MANETPDAGKFEQSPIRYSPGSTPQVIVVLFSYVLVEADFVLDALDLHSHNAHVDFIWLYPLMITVSLLLYLRGLWKRGIVRIGKELRDYSVLYFSMAVMLLLFSQTSHRGIIVAAYKARHAIVP
jgi:hypothetical protein